MTRSFDNLLKPTAQQRDSARRGGAKVAGLYLVEGKYLKGTAIFQRWQHLGSLSFPNGSFSRPCFSGAARGVFPTPAGSAAELLDGLDQSQDLPSQGDELAQHGEGSAESAHGLAAEAPEGASGLRVHRGPFLFTPEWAEGDQFALVQLQAIFGVSRRFDAIVHPEFTLPALPRPRSPGSPPCRRCTSAARSSVPPPPRGSG